ncbi:MAG: preprotein translocase subunit SecE [Armatimonadetes bacterium]|nr:preprotein translocase subunit SecE [Armatimonadota bacterium]
MAIGQLKAIKNQSGSGSPSDRSGKGKVSWYRSLVRFFEEVITELQKTSWPTKEEATRLTIVVVGVILAIGTYMGLLDFGITFLNSKFHLLK